MFTTFGANSVLDGDPIPATLYLKLHVGDPGVDATGNPATETDRVAFTRAAASGGATSNAADLDWTSVAGTEDYTHVSAWDAATAGNPWLVGTCTANGVTAGDNFTLPAGDVDLSLDLGV